VAGLAAVAGLDDATTGGWRFAQFDASKPADEAAHRRCFPRHEPAKVRDFVFTSHAR